MDADRERRHHPPPAASPADPSWCEVFTWESEPVADQVAVSVRLVLHRRAAWYLAAVVVPGRPLIVVTDLEVPAPSSSSSLELRTSGLWADHNIETPFAHVSIGLEAFGVALDDPADALADGYGQRVPVGFDLEWEDDRPPIDAATHAYECPGRAHGEVLVGADAFEVDGPGQRRHEWGRLDWHGPGWWRASIRWDDGAHVAGGGVGVPPEAPEGRVVAVAADGSRQAEWASLDVWWDDWGLPAAATLAGAGTRVSLDVVACSPVPLDVQPTTRPDRTPAVLWSVLVAALDGQGRNGRGWLEIVGPGRA
jgi:hypothetical protein